MNILILNWRDLKHSWAGGGEIYIFELAKRWVKAGHSVTVLCGQDVEKKLPSQETYDGIRIIRKGGRFSLYVHVIAYYLFQLKEKPDFVVDVENGIPFFTPLFCRKPKACIVYHVHGKQFFYELPFPLSSIGYFIEKHIFPMLYRTVTMMVISETTQDELIKIGFKKNKINIVYCGINGKNKARVVQEKFIQPTILYLGRIKKYKRVDLLVKIMPKVLLRVPTARLLIAGWGTEASTVTDISMRSIVRKKVKIIGPVDESDKKQLLEKSWVFVNASIGEGWSISVIEANLYGTPAVAFNVPGLSESIQNGKTGYLANNEEEFIEKICHVLNNKNERLILSKNAQEWARKYTWDDAAEKSMKLIKRIIH